MGGRSESKHSVASSTGILHFTGTINTDGGGFASIRTRLTEEQRTYLFQESAWSTRALSLRIRGDGKTYKFFMTDGSRAGPMARMPTWQMDIPTKDYSKEEDAELWQEVVVPFHQLLPSFAGSTVLTDAEKSRYTFDPNEIAEMGVMLSLKLADGRPNPVDTFGQGVFPFTLLIHSIQPITLSPSSAS
jgi:Complex I intermediate-associated protein 30 (CIA30)